MGHFEFITMDILGPWPRTKHGNQFVTVTTDRYSKLTKTVHDIYYDWLTFDRCTDLPIENDSKANSTPSNMYNTVSQLYVPICVLSVYMKENW